MSVWVQTDRLSAVMSLAAPVRMVASLRGTSMTSREGVPVVRYKQGSRGELLVLRSDLERWRVWDATYRLEHSR